MSASSTKSSHSAPSALPISPKARNRRRGGSIADVGWRFRVFRISNLEMVDQNIASWNPLIGWLRNVRALRSAA